MYDKLIASISIALEEHGIPYMIIGGQAVLLYGSPRLTKDIDITLGLGVNGLPEVISLIAELGLAVIPENYEEFVRDTMVLPLKDEKTGIRIDLIFSYTPYEEEAIHRARAVRLGARSVRFAAPEDVIIHKIFAGRPRDMEDASVIITKNPDIDREYVRRWLEEFDRSSEDSTDFLATFDRLYKKIG